MTALRASVEPVLRSDDGFPTAVEKLPPLSMTEEAIVTNWRLLMRDLRERHVLVRTLPLDIVTAGALERALDVASSDRDRLGDHLVHLDKARRQAERECDAARRAAGDAHDALDHILSLIVPLLEWSAPQLGVSPTLTAVLAAVPSQPNSRT